MTNDSNPGAESLGQALSDPAVPAGLDSFKIIGPLTVNTAEELRGRLLTYLRQTKTAVIDLAAVDTCDCAGLQLLLAAHKSATAAGGSLQVRDLALPVLDLAKRIGLNLDCLAPQPAVSSGTL
jgi:anti-anti-sigma factor